MQTSQPGQHAAAGAPAPQTPPGPREAAPAQAMVPAGRYYGVHVWLSRHLPRLAWI